MCPQHQTLFNFEPPVTDAENPRRVVHVLAQAERLQQAVEGERAGIRARGRADRRGGARSASVARHRRPRRAIATRRREGARARRRSLQRRRDRLGLIAHRRRGARVRGATGSRRGNAHDLERILAHYRGRESYRRWRYNAGAVDGTYAGRTGCAAIRRGLDAFPQSAFTLERVAWAYGAWCSSTGTSAERAPRNHGARARRGVAAWSQNYDG